MTTTVHSTTVHTELAAASRSRRFWIAAMETVEHVLLWSAIVYTLVWSL